MLVCDVTRNLGIHAALALQTREFRSDLDHTPYSLERHSAQFFVALAIQVLGVLQKTSVALDILRRLLLHLSVERLLIVQVIEAVSVLPAKLIKRRDRQQRDVVVHVTP